MFMRLPKGAVFLAFSSMLIREVRCMYIFDRPFLTLILPIVLFTAGCGHITTFKGVSIDEDALLITRIPPVIQDDKYSCGVACVASVLFYWGKPFPPDGSLDASLFARHLSGKHLKQIADAAGLNAFSYSGSMGDLYENIEKGRPIIVMIRKPVDPRIRFSNIVLLLIDNDLFGGSHWVIVVGFNGKADVIIHDPALGKLVIKRSLFEKWWESKKNLCLLVAPTEREK